MAGADAPGPVIGAGRTADIYALGPDRVLRRYREGYNAEREAELMTYLAGAGFPVPRVYDASGPDLVMERLQGRDMLADLAARPWLAGQHARTLAGLHDRLHEIAAPSSLAQRYGAGDRVLHLDFHPGNVMLTPSGPVVIDWQNCSSGAPAVDVAMVWVIIAASDADVLPWRVRPVVSVLRRMLLRQFLSAVQADPMSVLANVARARMKDPHVRPAEVRRLEELASRAERQSAARPSARP